MPKLAGSKLGTFKEDEGKITRVECTTTASPEAFTLEVRHSWSPRGAERFVALVKDEYFTDVALFRCVKNFLVQFGIAPDPSSPKKKFWREKGPIQDDPNLHIEFKRGTLSFAGGGPNTRGTQLFITFRDLDFLGKEPWETPLGVVTKGMETVVDKFFTGYGDQQPFNKKGPSQGVLQERGNEYLMESFPEMSYLKECHVVDEMNAEEHASVHVQDPQPNPNHGVDGNDGWIPSNQLGPPKSEDEQLVLHGMAGKGGSKSGEMNDGEGVSISAFALLALGLVAVFVVWKKSRKDHRRVR